MRDEEIKTRSIVIERFLLWGVVNSYIECDVTNIQLTSFKK